MRFLHTADWHLGRIFHGLRLTEEQSYLLDQLIELTKAEKTEAVIIAGDIYETLYVFSTKSFAVW